MAGRKIKKFKFKNFLKEKRLSRFSWSLLQLDEGNKQRWN